MLKKNVYCSKKQAAYEVRSAYSCVVVHLSLLLLRVNEHNVRYAELSCRKKKTKQPRLTESKPEIPHLRQSETSAGPWTKRVWPCCQSALKHLVHTHISVNRLPDLSSSTPLLPASRSMETPSFATMMTTNVKPSNL